MVKGLQKATPWGSPSAMRRAWIRLYAIWRAWDECQGECRSWGRLYSVWKSEDEKVSFDPAFAEQ